MKGLVQLPTTAGVVQIFSTLMLPVLHSLINWHISPVPTDTALQKLILNKSFYPLHVCAGFMCVCVCSFGSTVLSAGVLTSPGQSVWRAGGQNTCQPAKDKNNVENSTIAQCWHIAKHSSTSDLRAKSGEVE